MNNRTKAVLAAALRATVTIILYACFVTLAILGVRETGWAHLGWELLGLAGAIGMLWAYNLRHR